MTYLTSLVHCLLLLLALCSVSTGLAAAEADNLRGDCPAILQGSVQKLHSRQTIALCDQFAGKPLLVVNTASYCGYTPQFKALESLYQRYKDQGLEILGVPSDDFNQEDDNAGKTAEVCYKNYGVTFTMTATQHVRGVNAHPIFREIQQQSGKAPSWNFHKFVVDRNGRVTATFPSQVTPESPTMVKAIESVL